MAEHWIVSAARDLPLAADESWDGSAAAAAIFEWAGGDQFDPEKAGRGFLLRDTSAGAERGAFKEPFAVVVDGDLKASRAGLRAAAARLPQVEDIGDDVKASARDVIDHYEKKDKATAELLSDESRVIQEWRTLENLSDRQARVQVREIRIHELRGAYPEVPTYPSVDTELLTKDDPKPFYLVLPIARAGETSENHLDYDKALVASVAEQLQGLGGIRGHIPEDQRASAFPIEDVDWVGHAMVGDTLWAKGYIPPGDTRDYIRRVKARNGKLSTSIYGGGIVGETANGNHRLIDFTLEQVDLAPAKRAALQLGGDFDIVHELQHGASTMAVTKEDLAKLTPSDLCDLLDEGAWEQVAQMYAKKKNKKMVAAEMAERLEANQVTITELNTQTSTQARELDTLRARVSEYEDKEFASGSKALVSEALPWKNLDKANTDQQALATSLFGQIHAALVREMAGKRDLALAKAKVSELVESDQFRPLIQMTAQMLSGGAAHIGAGGSKISMDDVHTALSTQRQNVGMN